MPCATKKGASTYKVKGCDYLLIKKEFVPEQARKVGSGIWVGGNAYRVTNVFHDSLSLSVESVYKTLVDDEDMAAEVQVDIVKKEITWTSYSSGDGYTASPEDTKKIYEALKAVYEND